jgi:hypothetical protein
LGAPYIPSTFSLTGAASRNGPGQRRELTKVVVEPQNVSWGSGRFLQGLRTEIKLIEQEDLMLASYEPAKYSSKRNGIIAGYGANTNQGIIR